MSSEKDDEVQCCIPYGWWRCCLFKFLRQVNANYHQNPSNDQWRGLYNLDEVQKHCSPCERWVNLQMSSCTQRVPWGPVGRVIPVTRVLNGMVDGEASPRQTLEDLCLNLTTFNKDNFILVWKTKGRHPGNFPHLILFSDFLEKERLAEDIHLKASHFLGDPSQ